MMVECEINKAAATAWYGYCRDVAAKIAWHEYGQIGGDNDVVEVDETHLFRRKYNRGRLLQQWAHIWVFGGISRTSKKVFGCLVPDGSRNTLLLEKIHPGSYICSDEWRAYNRCNQHFAGHGTVNHSIAFVNPPSRQNPLFFSVGRFTAECLDTQ